MPPSQPENVPARRTVRAVDIWTQQTIDATPGVVAGLRRAIEAALVDGHLAITDRRRLIERAERLGVNRFEASLLIAAVQHRSGEARDDRVIRAVWKRPAKSRSVAKLVAACVVLEAVALSAAVAWLT